MKLIVLCLLIFSAQIYSEEFNVNLLMSEYGLSPQSIENINDGQYYNNHHFVTIEFNELQISTKDKRTGSLGFEENGIRYFTTNKGEWGAKLEVAINSVNKLLLEEYVSHIYPKYSDGGALYIVHNTSMNNKNSKLSVISDRSKPSKPKLITLLPDTPYSFHTDKSKLDRSPLVMLGEKSIMVLHDHDRLEILLWNVFWENKLFPSSIVRYKNNYFVGLSHGVAVVPVNDTESTVFYADKEFNK